MIGSQNYTQNQDAKSETSENIVTCNLDGTAINSAFSTEKEKFLDISDLKHSKSDLYDSGFSSRASTTSNSPEESPCPSEATSRSCKAKQLDSADFNKFVKEKLNIKESEESVEDTNGVVDVGLNEPMSSIESSLVYLNNTELPSCECVNENLNVKDDEAENVQEDLDVLVEVSDDDEVLSDVQNVSEVIIDVCKEPCVTDVGNVSGIVDDSLLEPLSSIESSFTTLNETGPACLNESASNSIQYFEPEICQKDKLVVPGKIRKVEFKISDESLASSFEDIDDHATNQLSLTAENLKLLEEGKTSTPTKDSEETLDKEKGTGTQLKCLRLFSELKLVQMVNCNFLKFLLIFISAFLLFQFLLQEKNKVVPRRTPFT